MTSTYSSNIKSWMKPWMTIVQKELRGHMINQGGHMINQGGHMIVLLPTTE